MKALGITTLAAAAAKSLQSCPTLQPQRWQPTRLHCSWGSPGKDTGVGCHFLLKCMKVKSESEVAQSCLTLRDPMDCSPPGSSVHGIFQARVLEWGAMAFSLLHLRESIYLISKENIYLHRGRSAFFPHSHFLPDGQCQNRIYYILCSQRWRSSIQSAKNKTGS